MSHSEPNDNNISTSSTKTAEAAEAHTKDADASGVKDEKSYIPGHNTVDGEAAERAFAAQTRAPATPSKRASTGPETGTGTPSRQRPRIHSPGDTFSDPLELNSPGDTRTYPLDVEAYEDAQTSHSDSDIEIVGHTVGDSDVEVIENGPKKDVQHGSSPGNVKKEKGLGDAPPHLGKLLQTPSGSAIQARQADTVYVVYWDIKWTEIIKKVYGEPLAPYVYPVPGPGPVKLDTLPRLLQHMRLKPDESFHWWNAAVCQWEQATSRDACGHEKVKVLLVRRHMGGSLSGWCDFIAAAHQDEKCGLTPEQLLEVTDFLALGAAV